MAGGAVPAPGMRVVAPFGRRRAIGVVTAIAASSALPRAQLKSVLSMPDAEPLWDATTFALLSWAAEYYHHPPGEVLFAAMPKQLRDGEPARRDELRWRLSVRGREALAATPRLGARQRELAARIGDADASAEEIAAAVQSHLGGVHASSIPNEGSLFTLYFPVTHLLRVPNVDDGCCPG